MHYSRRLQVRADLEWSIAEILEEGLRTDIIGYVTSSKYHRDQQVHVGDISLRGREILARAQTLRDADPIYRVTFWRDDNDPWSRCFAEQDEAESARYYWELHGPNINSASIETIDRCTLKGGPSA